MGKIAVTFKKVMAMLEANPKYRDSDRMLVTKFWSDELNAMGIDSKSRPIRDFWLMYRDDWKFTTSDTITRCRRKANEDYPKTRGLSYKPRKEKVKEVQEEIQTLTPGMSP